jgi:hypothetical protein
VADYPDANGIVRYKNGKVIFKFGAPFDKIRVKKGKDESLRKKSFVVSVKIEEKNEENKWVLKKDFPTPFSLEVKYDSGDLTSLGLTEDEYEQLVLYFSDVGERAWKKFDGTHGYTKPVKNSHGSWLGYGLASGISTWPDPVIAWGG